MADTADERRTSIGITLLVAFGSLALLPLLAALVGGIAQRAVRAPIEELEATGTHFVSYYQELIAAAIEVERLAFAATAGSPTLSRANAVERIGAELDRVRALLDSAQTASQSNVNIVGLRDAFERIEPKLREIAAEANQQIEIDALIGTKVAEISQQASRAAELARARAGVIVDQAERTRVAEGLANLRFWATTLAQAAGNAASTSDGASVTTAETRYASGLRSAIFQLSLLPPDSETARLAGALDALFALGRGPQNLFALQAERILAREQMREHYAVARAEVRAFLQIVDSLMVASSELTQDDLERAASALERSALALVIAAAASIAIALWVSRRYVYAGLIQRLRKLTKTTRRLSEGDLDADIALDGNDEITDLQNALLVFRRTARRLEERDRALALRSEELEAANRELDNFAYVASHDLRAPLRAVDSLATFVIEDVGDALPEESAHHLELMKGRIARLDALLVSLLEYSRIARKELAMEEVDLGPLVQSSVELVGHDAFDVQLTGVYPVVRTAKAPVSQIVRNLIDNAIKHHDRHQGQIRVHGRMDGDIFELAVHDDGPGIEPEYHERIFGLFQTLKSRDEVEGSGMGLSMLRKTLERLGGSISISSDPRARRGTAFITRWPVEQGLDQSGTQFST